MHPPSERLQVTERLPATDGVIDPRAPLPSTIGRYQLGPQLGAGGMAEVYRAFDPTLNRHVALKLLRETDQAHLSRFLREARAQAQVGHENICDVYETGIVEGRPFIAMRCIEGMTLADAAMRMSIRDRVRVMVDVAGAVQAAHRTGLVHRDLKPNNIMVEPTADGGWHPWVLDFGLARDSSVDTMTTIGTVVGTPPYMAPEQARADRARIDDRTDVYSLGATLFDLLTGRPPFVAESTLDIMMQVVHNDPPAVRSLNPAIAPDLDTIVMKCLEKDPARRYESARAFADDLTRYLDGEPILARPTSLVYRWSMRARKHPTIAALLAIATVAVLASLAWAIVTSWQSSARQQAAQRFGQEVERIEAVHRYAAMLPLHDIRREREWIRARIVQIERDATSLSPSSAGPARYAIGRGHLALGEWAASRKHLDAAWAAEFQTPEVAYALGRVIGAQYQEEIEEAERIANADARAARRKQIDTEYRDTALTWLRRGRGTGSESSAYAEGLIAFYEKRYDTALASARKAFREVPWLYEARKLEGDIWIARGIEAANDGEAEQSIASLTQAIDAYQSAEEIASSDERVMLGLAEAWFRRMILAVNRGEEPAEYVRNGVAAAERAVATGGDLEAGYRTQALILQRYSDWQLSQGQPPLETLERSIALARKAVAADPQSGFAHRSLGNALFTRARYAQTHGEDSLPLYDASIQSLRQSAALESRNANILMSLANSIRRKAEVVGTKGGNPVPLLNESIVIYDRAAAANPEFANTFNDRGLAFMTRGEWEMENGIDPTSSFNETLRSLQKAIALNPKFSVAMLNLGSTHLDRGNYEMRRGLDPRPMLREAVAAYDSALKINPKLAFAHANTGLAHFLGAQDALDRNEDPEPWIENGLAAYARALEINPDHANSFAYRGSLFTVRAQAQLRRGLDPTAALAEARAWIRRGDAIDPDSADFMLFAAQVELEAARHAIANRRTAAPFLAQAERFLARGISENAADADLLHAAAEAAQLQRGYDRALELIEKALRVNGEKSESHALRGELLLVKARDRGDTTIATDALRALDRAMQLKPTTRWKWVALREQASRAAQPER